MNDVNVGYSKNDFLYYKYAFDSSGKEQYNCSDNTIVPGVLKNTCGTPPPNGNDMCSQNFITNLCKNKEYADKLVNQKIHHSGSDELYQNTTAQYNIERLNLFNLGIGVIISGFFIMNM
jgi:hypothetical protein